MSKVVQKKNHWTTRVNECAVSKDARGELNVQLLGGAENGEFAHIGHVKESAVQYRHGKVSEGELLLEVETLSVSGLPLYDVLTVIKNCKGPIRLKTVRQGKGTTECPLCWSHGHSPQGSASSHGLSYAHALSASACFTK
ncbi:hypothetical protein DNTS_003741 [Danionella cerebrum]|uniref:PDZ domain-containing protein n=1 Tax=Danionella cerebrum TaxID=2873325 RepID=A0A553RGS4_9TELE|nr:hypothetical protein DNTS_003741 [Danionella translucida]